MGTSSGRVAAARVLLRLPAPLHRRLVAAARDAGVSFNEHCVRRLAAPAGVTDPAVIAVIERARAAAGAGFLGVMAIGSWARGEAAAESDVDVLVVVDATVDITRELYRRWDREELRIDGRRVDAHFVKLPGWPPGAMWCEAAVDGMVWADERGELASALAQLRRAIADGRLVRGMAHGQSYWKGVG